MLSKTPTSNPIDLGPEFDHVNTADAARVLLITPWRVRQLIRNGTIPARRVGDEGTYLIRRSDLLKVLEAGTVKVST